MSKTGSMSYEERIEIIKKEIESFPDFPKPGILFRDFFSVLRKPDLFKELKDLLVEYVVSNNFQVDVIMGLESRGFIFGPILALELKVPFVPIRKKGKLPGEIKSVKYALEYGTDAFEAQTASISEGQHVLIVDDLLATGGSLNAACELVKELNGKVSLCLVIMELVDLEGQKKVPHRCHSLIQF